MRHSFKGASALAALCAGALAFSALPAQAYVPGASGNSNADVARVAGIDRTQTALEATTASGVIDKFFIVGYGSQVDALSLAPWNCGTTGYVLYERGNAVEARNLKVLEHNSNAEIFVIGGKGVVSEGIEKQLRALNEKGKVGDVYRVGGKDRYDTAYQVGAMALEECGRTTSYVKPTKVLIDTANKAIEDYNNALAAYNKAAANEVAAQAKFDAATAAVDAAFAKVIEVSSKHIDTAELEAAVEEAKAKAEAATKGAQAKIDTISVIIDGVATFDWKAFGKPVQEVKIQDFIDAADPVKNAAELATLKVVLDNPSVYGGITADMSLQAAIDIAKTKIAEFEKQKQDAATAVSDYYLKLFEKIQAENNNAALIADIAQARKAYNAALAAKDKAAEELHKAQAALNVAIDTLVAATQPYLDALRLLPYYLRDYDAELANAYKNTVAPIFVSTGVNFADTLAAGPAAAKQHGIVLLTKDEQVPPLTKKALDLSKSQSVAIGGPAVRALKSINSQAAGTISGKDRYETAVKVAKRYFADGAVTNNYNLLYALASGEVAADAVVAGPYLTSQYNFGGVLLTRQGSLPKVTADFLAYGTTGANQTTPYIDAVAVFGGKGAISNSVFAEAEDALKTR